MKERFRLQPENPKQHAPEAGAGPLGLPPPSPERRQLPSVWDVLEGQAKIHEERSSNRMTRQEYNCERSKLIGLEDEIGEKGTRRDRLIIGLYNTMTLETTGTLPNPGASKNAVFGLNSLTGFWTQQYQPITPILTGVRTH